MSEEIQLRWVMAVVLSSGAYVVGHAFQKWSGHRVRDVLGERLSRALLRAGHVAWAMKLRQRIRVPRS